MNNIYEYRKFLYPKFNIIEEKENNKSFFFRFLDNNEDNLIKCMKNNDFFNFEIMEQIKNIDSDFILKILEIYKDNNYNYVITPFLDNYFTLRNLLIRKINKISAEDLINLINYLADGIDSFHKNNIVHFDLVSINILIREDFKDLKIIDFDLCKKKENDLSAIDKTSFFEIILRLIVKYNMYNKHHQIQYNKFKLDFFDEKLTCKKIVETLELTTY